MMLPLLLALVPVQDEEAPRPSYAKCVDASEGITSDMRDCISAEYAYQDARLNATYKAVMARLTPAQQATLRASERRWLREREPRCIRESEAQDLGTGTLELVERYQCLMFALIERIDWLKTYKPR